MSKSLQFSQAIRSWLDVSMPRSMRGWSHHARAEGLSMPQFSILMQLHYRGHCGISDVSQRFEITPAAASQLVEKLVQSGLIERAEDPTDRRVKQLQLSEKGKALIEKGISERYRWAEKLGDGLAEKDRQKIVEALTILTEETRKLD